MWPQTAGHVMFCGPKNKSGRRLPAQEEDHTARGCNEQTGGARTHAVSATGHSASRPVAPWSTQIGAQDAMVPSIRTTALPNHDPRSFWTKSSWRPTGTPVAWKFVRWFYRPQDISYRSNWFRTSNLTPPRRQVRAWPRVRPPASTRTTKLTKSLPIHPVLRC